MNTLRPTVATVVDPVDLAIELMHAMRAADGVYPTRESICVLLAQSAIETGRWRSMSNWNFGNVKAVGVASPLYYKACTEVLTPTSAKAHLVAPSIGLDGLPTVRHVRTIDAGLPRERWVLEFRAPHPACAFRSFDTIDEGIAFYLEFLSRKYASAWAFVRAGDPAGFVRALKALGYFTADLDEYLAAVMSIFREYLKLPFVLPSEEGQARERGEVDYAAVDAAVTASLTGLSWRLIEEAARED